MVGGGRTRLVYHWVDEFSLMKAITFQKAAGRS